MEVKTPNVLQILYTYVHIYTHKHSAGCANLRLDALIHTEMRLFKPTCAHSRLHASIHEYKHKLK